MEDKLAELERRINKYMQQSLEAEKVALEKLMLLPKSAEALSPIEVLRRERFRHHTRTLTLKEVKEWVRKLRSSEALHEDFETE